MMHVMQHSKPMTTDLKQLLAKRGLKLIDLAKELGVERSTATRWAQRRVPANRVLQIEKAVGIKRKLLRPDLYL